MQTTGTINDISIDYKTSKPKISILLDQRESISSLEAIKEDKLSIEIKKYHVVLMQINTFGNYYKRFANTKI